MDIVQSDNCDRDYLEVRRENRGGQLLGVFCGNTVPPIITTNTSLWLLFESKTDDATDAVTAKGFLAEYTLSNRVYFFVII